MKPVVQEYHTSEAANFTSKQHSVTSPSLDHLVDYCPGSICHGRCPSAPSIRRCGGRESARLCRCGHYQPTYKLWCMTRKAGTFRESLDTDSASESMITGTGIGLTRQGCGEYCSSQHKFSSIVFVDTVMWFPGRSQASRNEQRQCSLATCSK